jgi:hypothetical protein
LFTATAVAISAATIRSSSRAQSRDPAGKLSKLAHRGSLDWRSG